MRILNKLLKITLLTLLALNNVQAKQSTEADTQVLKNAAKKAYIFSYPMVMYYRSMYMQALDPKKGVGMGKWLNLGISTPEDTTIVTPNNDTPYSYAWVDLRTEPYVVTLPKIEANRFYTSQWDDMFGYVLDNPGSVEDGNDGVTVMLVSPDWKGKLPKGVKRVIKGDSYILGSLTRTQLITPDDLPNVERIQKEYKLQPLSSYLGTKAPMPAPKVNWPTWHEDAEFKEDFWAFAGFVSQFVVKNPEDAAMWEALGKFGFEQGKAWDISKLTPTQKEALLAGQQEALNHLKDLASKPFDPKKFFNNREGFKRIKDAYVQNALGVMVGIFGNTANQSVYYSFQKDANGNRIDASKTSYRLHFNKGQLPDVKNFWSLTMYSLPNRWLVANKINRHSVGSATKGLKENADGSLDIYIQSQNPGKEKEGNWLPSPDGPFWMVLRCYGPDKSMIEGTWTLPTLIPEK